jgi:hypothetical protein
MYSGGNMWVAGVDFISFFRHIAKLDLDYSKWQHYETAATHAGWRLMHPKFCIIVDFPEFIKIDASRRPHCSTGPSHRWCDGWEVFYWHGLAIPPSHHWIITDKAALTFAKITSEPNAELRRVMLEIALEDKPDMIAQNTKVIASDKLHGHKRKLLFARVGGADVRFVEVVNGSLEPDGTRRKFILGAMPGNTPHEVIAASYGIAPKVYQEAVRT